MWKLAGALKGKKTYVVAAMGVLTAVAGLLTGDISPQQAIQLGWEATMGATLRAGIAKAEL